MCGSVDMRAQRSSVKSPFPVKVKENVHHFALTNVCINHSNYTKGKRTAKDPFVNGVALNRPHRFRAPNELRNVAKSGFSFGFFVSCSQSVLK